MRGDPRMVTGCKPGIPSGPDLYKGKPSSFTGPRTEWPTKPCGELPSLLSQRIREHDLPGHVAAPDLAPRVRSMPVTRDVRSKNAAPPDRRAGQDKPRAGPGTPASLILRRGLGQLHSLTRGQRRSSRPRDTTGGGVHRRCILPTVMMSTSMTGHPRLVLGKTPLTGRAVR